MPLYEYECDANGHRFEIIQKSFSDPPPERCPTCGSPVHKLMSSPAIQFKGTGWYITDYARKGDAGTKDGKSAKGGDSSDSKDSKDSKETKSDSTSKTDASSSSSAASTTPVSTSTPKE
jgi:putative FmdB family regulatory protein